MWKVQGIYTVSDKRFTGRSRISFMKNYQAKRLLKIYTWAQKKLAIEWCEENGLNYEMDELILKRG